MLAASGADSTLLGIAAIVAAVFSGVATVYGAMNRRSLRVPVRRTAGTPKPRRIGVGETLADMRTEMVASADALNHRLDLHEARSADQAHGG
jgi:hypothetical protein